MNFHTKTFQHFSPKRGAIKRPGNIRLSTRGTCKIVYDTYKGGDLSGDDT